MERKEKSVQSGLFKIIKRNLNKIGMLFAFMIGLVMLDLKLSKMTEEDTGGPIIRTIQNIINYIYWKYLYILF